MGSFSRPFSNFYFLVDRWLGESRQRRRELAGGEGIQGAEAASEFDGGQAALAVEPSGSQKRLHVNSCLAEDRPERALCEIAGVMRNGQLSSRLRMAPYLLTAGALAVKLKAEGTKAAYNFVSFREDCVNRAGPRDSEAVALCYSIVPITDGLRQQSPDNHLSAGGGTLSFARFRSKCACSSLSPGSMNVQSSVWWSASMMVNTK